MRIIFLLGILWLTLPLYAQKTEEKVYLIKADKLYDSDGNRFLTKQEILLRGKYIEKVGVNLAKPANAEVIRLANCTVSPGLIDAHTHVLTIQNLQNSLEYDVFENSEIERTLRAVGICKSFLMEGYTTIRDVGNSGMFLDLNLQRAIQKGWIDGPNMIISGPILSPEDGQFFDLSSQNRHLIDKEYRVVRNVADARQAVKDHISHGVNLIKVVMGDGKLILPIEEVKTIVETAHAYGIKVTAHATYDKVINMALEAGVDGIEHGYNIADSLLEKMVQKKVYLVPTISSYETFVQVMKDNKTEEYIDQLKDYVANNEKIIQKAMAKGVTVVNGSDMYLYTKQGQGTTAKGSIVAYYQAHKKANDILQTATKNAAIACGVGNSTGVIKENRIADIVAFEGDMEKDFEKSIYKVKFVMKEGVIYKQ